MKQRKQFWVLISVIVVLLAVGYIGHRLYRHHSIVPVHNSSSQTTTPKPNIQVLDLKTPSGQKAWLVENHHTQVISLSFIFRNAGDKSDPEGKVGRAHLATALFLEGAGPYNNQQLKEKFLEQYLQINVTTEEDEIKIFARFPAENLKAVTELLKLVLTSPRYEEESLTRIRNQTLVIFQQALHNENVLAQITLAETIYGQHPYGRTVKNALNDLPHLTLEDVRAYHQERLALDQLEIVAVGDFVADDFLKTIDTIIQGLPPKAKPLNIPNADLQNLGKERVVNLDIPQSQIIFLQPGIARNDPDFIPAVLMNRLLGSGGWKSLLWEEVREKGYAYAVDTDLQLFNHAQLLIGDAGSKNESARKVIQLIRESWEKMLKTGVTQQDLDFAKEYVTGAFIVGLDSTAHICKVLAHLQYLGLEPNYMNERNELINAVTLDDINRVIKRLLNPELLTFIVVGNPKD